MTATIPMPAMATEEQVAATLTWLTAICTSAAAGYDVAAAEAQDRKLRPLFVARAAERRRFVAELELLRAELGSFPKRVPSGVRAPGWAAEAAAKDDRALLERCDRGETASRKAYEAALREAPLFVLPLPVRTIVQRQYAALLYSHAELQRTLWR